MPIETDYRFGRAAVGAGELTQDRLEECVEVLVALERVGTRKRLWDVVVGKGYMTEEAIARLLGQIESGTVPDGRADAAEANGSEETAAALPIVRPRVEGHRLAVLGAGGTARSVPLPRRLTTLGREADCDIELDMADVAPQHARLRITDAGFSIEAVSPAHSVLVNDRPVSKCNLSPNDLVQVGTARLLFLADYGDQDAPEPTAAALVDGTPATQLKVEAGPRAGVTFFLGERAQVIGSDALAGIRLADSAVAEFQCHLAPTPDGWRLLNLGGAGTTRVNGADVDRCLLKEQDRVSVGPYTLCFGPVEQAPRPKGEFEISLEAEVEPSTDLMIKRELIDHEQPIRQPAPRGYAVGQLQLIGLEGPAEGRRFVLKNRVNTIGRDKNSAVWINDDSVSRRHAQVVLDSRQTAVRDLGSRNGVYVNGTRVEAAPLRKGDTLRIGKCLFLTEEVRK